MVRLCRHSFFAAQPPSAGAVVAANPAGTPFSSASDFSFDYEPGVNVALAGDAASRSLLNPSLLRDINYSDLFYQGAVMSIDFVW